MNPIPSIPHLIALGTLLTSALLATPAHAATQPLSPDQEIKQKVPQALGIIKQWRNSLKTEPQQKRTLHVVYWTPSDREPAPEYRERLSRAMLHIQKFYAKEMKRLGFGPQTIQLDLNSDQLLNIHLVKAPRPYATYKPSDGQIIRKECQPVLQQAGIDNRNETVLIFCNMSNWDPEKRIITQNSPYYAGGTHCSGCAWQVDSPILDPVFLSKKQPKVRDGQYGHISIGRYNSIFVGGICHELGHALGLPHNCQRKDEQALYGTSLMGAGNRSYGEELRGEGKGSFLTLASALRLTTHPMFSKHSQQMKTKGNASLVDIDIQAGNQSITASGKVNASPDSPPVYAVLAYFDPVGGSNYDAKTATAIPDKDGRFTLSCHDLKRNSAAALRLVLLYANGDATSHVGSRTPYTYPYEVDQNDQPSFSTWNMIKQFEPLQAAITKRDQQAIQSTLQQLSRSKDSRVAAIARRLLATQPVHPAPAEIPAKTTSVALADSTPASARVGYHRPSFNRLPRPNPLLQANGNIFTSGIYAHAPAKHQYELGGKWKTLSGKCAIADGSRGSCVFIIKADGQQLWRSKTVKPGKSKDFKVNLNGKQKLELIVEDAGDGTSSDWGLWLEPQLTR